MESIKVKCSQCTNLRKGEGKESFVSPQGIDTTVHRGRYYCEADISQRFTDEQIKEFRECFYFRPRTLTFQQEIKQKIILFLKQNFPTVLILYLKIKAKLSDN